MAGFVAQPGSPVAENDELGRDDNSLHRQCHPAVHFLQWETDSRRSLSHALSWPEYRGRGGGRNTVAGGQRLRINSTPGSRAPPPRVARLLIGRGSQVILAPRASTCSRRCSGVPELSSHYRLQCAQFVLVDLRGNPCSRILLVHPPRLSEATNTCLGVRMDKTTLRSKASRRSLVARSAISTTAMPSG